jgi:hypothetical protein
MATDPHFVQSAVFLEGDDSVFEYSPYYHLIRHFKPDHKQTLMIGGAGYTFPKEYLRRYQEARIDVVEIDPKMTEIARRFFRLEDDPRLSIFHEDGRIFLNHAGSDTYDAVLMDAFGSLFSVPYQLTTLEAPRSIEWIQSFHVRNSATLQSSLSGEVEWTNVTSARSSFAGWMKIVLRSALILSKILSSRTLPPGNGENISARKLLKSESTYAFQAGRESLQTRSRQWPRPVRII